MDIFAYLKAVIWILIVSGIVYYFTKSVKRLFQVAGGLALFEAYNNLFDVVLWPVIQGWFGGYGALGLTVTAFVLNFIMLKWYQKCRVDWLGITVTDDILKKGVSVKIAYEISSGLDRLKLAPLAGIYWIVEKAITVEIIPFLVLSIFGDSFIATAFILHQKNGHKDVALERGDYIVFILSTIFSCLVWTLFTEWAILPAFRNVWQTLF